jgi:crossover junction endodeoxyribonuclease RuvC
MMKILGIDPGLENTGWAVIEKKGDDFGMVEGGVIKTNKKEESPKRLETIYEQMGEVIGRLGIKTAGMETLFFAKNAKSAIKVAEAIGVIKLACKKSRVKLVELTPLQIKMALTGYGRAEKYQVEEMTRNILRVEGRIEPSHAADAAAAALTVGFGQR